MTQKIISICDVCDPESANQQASPITVALDKGKPKTFDLCAHHRAALIEPIARLAEEFGRSDVPGAPLLTPGANVDKRPLEDHPCLLCDRRYRSAQAVSQHLRGAHSLPIPGIRYVDVYGPTCPLCNQEMKPMHPRAHGFTSVGSVWLKAMEDPANAVVAQRIEYLRNLASE